MKLKRFEDIEEGRLVVRKHMYEINPDDPIVREVWRKEMLHSHPEEGVHCWDVGIGNEMNRVQGGELFYVAGKHQAVSYAPTWLDTRE